MVRLTEENTVTRIATDLRGAACNPAEQVSMSRANQHSDLLFDFGPRSANAKDSPLDWTPMEQRPFDSKALELSTLDFGSESPLPKLPTESSPNSSPDPAPPPGGFQLDGDVVLCPCPECAAPMSVRLWLMLADCWSCGITIELNDEQIKEVERALEKKPRFANPPPAAPATAQPTPSQPTSPVAKSVAPEPVAKQSERPSAASTPTAATSAPPVKSSSAPTVKRTVKPASPTTSSLPTTLPNTIKERATPTNTSPIPPAVTRPVPPPPPPPAPVASHAAARPAEEEGHDDFSVFRRFFRDMPAWLLSLILHLAALMLLALIDKPQEEEGPWIVLTASVSPVQSEGGDVVQITPDEKAKFDLPIPDKVDMRDPNVKKAVLAANEDARELRLDPNEVDPSLPDLETVKERIGNVSGIKNGMAARDPRLRVELVKREGGTTLTEASVARALRWFQRHQHASGKWSLNEFRRSGKNCNCGHEGNIDDDTAGTALALLPYLGAGQSHLVGIYKEETAKGLRWLIQQQKPNGDLRTNQGNSGMYAHGQATIVLCEAFAMTGDETLRQPAQKAVDFIVAAQYNDGGWRYTPAPRDQTGDTSVVGWQLMALQSGRSANLTVPESTFQRASAYLDKASSRDGAFYSYQPRSGPTPVMTAEGLLCRLYLGWNRSRPALTRGVENLLENHPPEQDRMGIYYWYYATQTMHHYGGEPWEKWNSAMRDVLTETQQKEGHAAGSWAPVGEHSSVGGRVYMTALSACTLEVYYRHLPIFRKIAVE